MTRAVECQSSTVPGLDGDGVDQRIGSDTSLIRAGLGFSRRDQIELWIDTKGGLQYRVNSEQAPDTFREGLSLETQSGGRLRLDGPGSKRIDLDQSESSRLRTMNGGLGRVRRCAGIRLPSRFESSLATRHGVELAAGGKVCCRGYVGETGWKRALGESNALDALLETVRGIAVGGDDFRNRCQEHSSSPWTQGKDPRLGRPGNLLRGVMGMDLADTPRAERHGLLPGVFLASLSFDVFDELRDPLAPDLFR
jgi:hypothetical protein